MNRANRPRMSRINGSSYDSRLMGRTSTGDGSTLSLDFTAMGGVLDPLITFSRADATARATFINSLGYVETVPAGQPQAPRFTFSETSIGTPRGLLLESPVTNVATNSNALPNAGGLTRTYPAGVLSPDGTANSQRFTKTDASTPRYIYPTTSFTVAASTRYMISVWLKYDGHAFTTQIQSDTAGDWNAGWGGSFVIDSSGITTGSRFGACSASTVAAYPNGWYRCTITITTGAAPSGVNPRFLIDVVGTTGVSVLVYGLQLEANGSESSYIATGASAVTRAVDTAIIAAGTNFSSWYTGGTTGTFVTEWCRCTATTTQRTVIATSDVSNQHLHQYIAATTSRLRLADKVPAFIETANASLDNSINKGAFSYAGSVQSLCLNGGTVVPGTLTFTTAPTWLSIGGPSNDGTSITDTAVVLNNAIRKIKYFPTRLSNAQLQTLSTL